MIVLDLKALLARVGQRKVSRGEGQKRSLSSLHAIALRNRRLHNRPLHSRRHHNRHLPL
ncbi:MAG TPA: hypothetical protein VEJ16_18315 [Alphaproteobacteria bacterium]|nr:hypothetical protein [Alphaproteobacteria bacterium]